MEEKPKEIHIILSENEKNPDLLFVEIEDENGCSVDIGTGYRKDGFYCIKITTDDFKKL